MRELISCSARLGVPQLVVLSGSMRGVYSATSLRAQSHGPIPTTVQASRLDPGCTALCSDHSRPPVLGVPMASSALEQVNQRLTDDLLATARPSPHKWLIAIAVMLGATLEVLDTSIVT